MPNDRISNRSSRPLRSPRDRTEAAPELVAQARLCRPAPAFMGRSDPTLAVLEQVSRALLSATPVLLVGAAGTGKGTIAEILHHFGGGEVPTLQRVTLGSSARLERLGGFAYLSPVEHLSWERQVQLLDEAGPGRLIFGTRLDPNSREGRSRLNPELVGWCPTHIHLPSLAERIDDLEALVHGIIQKRAQHRPVCGISDRALECLQGYGWPGNVTELQEVVARALAVGTSAQIELCDLPAALRLRDVDLIDELTPEQDFSLALAERRAVDRAMRFARFNKRRAARLLQVSKSTLYRKLCHYERD